ncbi:MAG: hypothetical protein WBW53_06145 [Terriglobales bacterium]
MTPQSTLRTGAFFHWLYHVASLAESRAFLFAAHNMGAVVEPSIVKLLWSSTIVCPGSTRSDP